MAAGSGGRFAASVVRRPRSAPGRVAGEQRQQTRPQCRVGGDDEDALPPSAAVAHARAVGNHGEVPRLAPAQNGDVDGVAGVHAQDGGRHRLGVE